jgi:WD40 repeat protein
MFRSRSGSSDNKLRLAWEAAVPDHVIALAWSPDGKALAAAAVSGPITVFDARSGEPQYIFAGHGFGTTALAWQPGGDFLASTGQDGTVRIWNTVTIAGLNPLDGGAAWVERLAWSSDGSMLATGAGRKVRVWGAVGNLIRELPPHAGTITDLAWRPRTNHLTTLAFGAATVFDPLAGAEPVRLFAWKGSPLRLAWSPDGKVLAHGNQDSTVHFWYYESGADLQMWGYATKVRELAWDFTSRYLATGGSPVVCVWDCGGPKGPEGTKPQMLEGHEDNLTAVAYQSHGYLLASAASDGQVLLWQPANKKAPKVGEFKFDDAEASAIAWSPDDKSLAAGSGTGTVAVFRAG